MIAGFRNERSPTPGRADGAGRIGAARNDRRRPLTFFFCNVDSKRYIPLYISLVRASLGPAHPGVRVYGQSQQSEFIARNRAPRVQIEYDLELYGAEKKIDLPFVMGVMADLSGKPAEPLPPVADRKFLEIDVDNFDDRLKAMKPRVAFQVPNTLTGEGNMSVEITFESMDDFSPAAVARKVEPLNKLLTARTQLANLLTYMDGKSKAEDLMAKVAQRPGAAAGPGLGPEAAQAPPARRLSNLMAEAQSPVAPAAAAGRRPPKSASSTRCSSKEFKPKTDRRQRRRSRPPCARWPSRRWPAPR